MLVSTALKQKKNKALKKAGYMTGRKNTKSLKERIEGLNFEWYDIAVIIAEVDETIEKIKDNIIKMEMKRDICEGKPTVANYNSMIKQALKDIKLLDKRTGWRCEGSKC